MIGEDDPPDAPAGSLGDTLALDFAQLAGASLVATASPPTPENVLLPFESRGHPGWDHRPDRRR
jgi:hypothetical protein